MNHCLQQAVWRNGGCNAAENACKTATLVVRITDIVPRHCAKPRGVGRKSGGHRASEH